MLPLDPVRSHGLTCDVHDLDAAEALVQGGDVKKAQEEIAHDGDVHVRETTRLRIADCLSFLAVEGGIDSSRDGLFQKICDVFVGSGSEKKSLHYPDALIYCVDDEPFMLKIYSRSLRGAGYSNVRTFQCPIEALGAVTRSTMDNGDSPHLIISDNNMPLLCGTEFLGKIRELPKKFQPSLAMISSHVGDEHVQKLAVQYNFEMAEKPIPLPALHTLVRDGLDRHPILSRVNKLLSVEKEIKNPGKNVRDAG